ncbi:glycosyltransferase [Rhodoferax sp.]|uniref:glycosyltransferase n=1 Tax=Rhodoferax sp. TaxID=50421 RepID=UPI00374CDE20
MACLHGETTTPVLIIGLDSEIVTDVVAPLVAAGYQTRLGTPTDLTRSRWDLVISAPSIPGLGAMELLAALRRPGADGSASLLLVGTAQQLAGAAQGQGVQHLVRPFESHELVALVQSMRSPLAQDAASLPGLPSAGPPPLPDEDAFLGYLVAEHARQRARRSPQDSFVVSLRLHEFDRYRERLPPGSQDDLWRQVSLLAMPEALADERMAKGKAGDLLLLLSGTSRREAGRRLAALSSRIAKHRFDLQGQSTPMSPLIGYRRLRNTASAQEAVSQAREAAQQSGMQLDLHPMIYRPGASARPPVPREAGPVLAWLARIKTAHALWIQYAVTMALGLLVPFLVYWGLGSIGFDISEGVYLFVVVTLVLTALWIWAEGFLALRRVDPPMDPAQPFPPATAIIAAYLPNEAPIIEDTVRAFLRVQYPAPLQIILAYNTPRDMPEIEERLQQIARQNPQFVPMRVLTSTSKAQNVNAALPSVTGEFTAVFDADHQPDPDSFRRAWRWISHGADVVQGHCLIRNGAASWVAKMVAVEFEQIYAVSHPGRTRLHGFGIFGGSNGYWRTGLLRELRMHGFMLTEDIDSSMRALVRGHRIVSDPYLVSRELAPETMAALTRQRLRWSQGWFQISKKWTLPALRSRHLSLRQKAGVVMLLVWREAYPWVSMQIIPLIAYWAVRAGSLANIDWFIPLFVVTTLFTLGTGPGQILFVYKLADPQIRKHASWFWFFLLTSTFFYAGLKNAWSRIAHLKEWQGETAWVVTSRGKTKK